MRCVRTISLTVVALATFIAPVEGSVQMTILSSSYMDVIANYNDTPAINHRWDVRYRSGVSFNQQQGQVSTVATYTFSNSAGTAGINISAGAHILRGTHEGEAQVTGRIDFTLYEAVTYQMTGHITSYGTPLKTAHTQHLKSFYGWDLAYEDEMRPYDGGSLYINHAVDPNSYGSAPWGLSNSGFLSPGSYSFYFDKHLYDGPSAPYSYDYDGMSAIARLTLKSLTWTDPNESATPEPTSFVVWSLLALVVGLKRA